MIRCDLQRHDIRPDAPVNRWRQVGEFETLGACKAQYEKNQEPVAGVDEDALSRNIAKMEFLDEGERHPSEEELKLRGETIAITVGAQILAERCFATDDPRLGSN